MLFIGTSAFSGVALGLGKQDALDILEDESHCRYTVGWLRLLHHCFTLSTNTEMWNRMITHASEIQDLLSTCCGLLLIPTHIPALYQGNLERVLRELSLLSRENSLKTISMLLDSKPNVAIPSVFFDMGSGKLLMNSSGCQAACELLYQICRHKVC